MAKTVAESEQQKAMRDSDGYLTATAFLDNWDDEEKTQFVEFPRPKCDCVLCKGFPE
jgi:hypothetical protein